MAGHLRVNGKLRHLRCCTLEDQPFALKSKHWGHKYVKTAARLAKMRSILILTGPAIKPGFNRSLLVDWWSIEVVDWVD